MTETNAILQAIDVLAAKIDDIAVNFEHRLAAIETNARRIDLISSNVETITGALIRLDARVSSIEPILSELSVAAAALTVGQRELRNGIEKIAERQGFDREAAIQGRRTVNVRLSAVEARLHVLEEESRQ